MLLKHAAADIGLRQSMLQVLELIEIGTNGLVSLV